MAETSNISWTHGTWNPWLGCDKISPECAKCYISRSLERMNLEPWGSLYRAKTTWKMPPNLEQKAKQERVCYRVFTCSLSDFFHVKADPWRQEAWDIIRETPHLVYLILTKRPELIRSRLPEDWGEDGYPNVWLGVSTGCRMSLNKMDSLRKIPARVRFVSAEPLLEDISNHINLEGFHWIITGGESGNGSEYLWNPQGDWRGEFAFGGRRTMRIEWAASLRDAVKSAGLPLFFKQVTAPRSGEGEAALGRVWHEFPEPPYLRWA